MTGKINIEVFSIQIVFILCTFILCFCIYFIFIAEKNVSIYRSRENNIMNIMYPSPHFISY